MISYVTIDDINSYAQETGDEEWQAYSDNDKKNFHYYAELTVLMYVNQPNDSDGNLWQFENENLLRAVKEQAIYMGRTKWQRKAAEAVRAETGKSITKGDVEMDVNHRDNISDNARTLLDMVLSAEAGIQKMIGQRG